MVLIFETYIAIPCKYASNQVKNHVCLVGPKSKVA